VTRLRESVSLDYHWLSHFVDDARPRVGACARAKKAMHIGECDARNGHLVLHSESSPDSEYAMRRNSPTPPPAPDAISNLFNQLGTRTSEEALAELVVIGLPAIERLVEGQEQGRPVCQPADADGRCFIDDISSLIDQVSRAHSKEFVQYVLAKQEYSAVKELVGYLGVAHDPKVLPILAEASRSKDSSVRRAAVRAMKELADVRAVPALLDRLKDSAELVAEAAMVALGTCGSERELAVLEDLASNGKNLARRGAATGAADEIRRRLGLVELPRKPGRTMTVSLDESHLTARPRAARSLRVHVKVGDKVGHHQRLACVVSKDGEFDLEAPFAGEVVEVTTTKDRVSVTMRQLVGR